MVEGIGGEMESDAWTEKGIEDVLLGGCECVW